MLKRLARAYLRWRHGLTEPWQRTKPPIGWAPWARVGLRRRGRYVLASRVWRAEERLRGWAFPPLTDEQLWPLVGAPERRAVAAAALKSAKAGPWLVVPAGLALTPSALVLTPAAPAYDGAVKPVSELSYGPELTDGAGI
ncbi:MAG TPA: hypothetical protein VGE74_28815 [Gemmata sp.]